MKYKLNLYDIEREYSTKTVEELILLRDKFQEELETHSEVTWINEHLQFIRVTLAKKMKNVWIKNLKNLH